MGRKHVVSYRLLNAADATTSQQSVEITTSEMDKASIQIKFSAPNAGALLLEARNHAEGDWYEIKFGEDLTVTSADSEYHLVLNEMPFMSMRLTWAPSAGAGTISANLTEKTTGA